MEENKEVFQKLINYSIFIGKLGLNERDVEYLIEKDLGNPDIFKRDLYYRARNFLTFMQEVKMWLGKDYLENNIESVLGSNWEQKLKTEATIVFSDNKEIIKELQIISKIELLNLCINNKDFSINNPDNLSVEQKTFISKEANKNGITIETISNVMGLAFRTVKNYIDN